MSDIEVNRRGRVVVLTLNRPEVKNALTPAMYLEIARQLDEAAADIDHFEPGAQALEFDVDPRQLDHGVLHVADVADLAADVEVQQLEAVEHVVLAQERDGLEDLVLKIVDLAINFFQRELIRADLLVGVHLQF